MWVNHGMQWASADTAPPEDWAPADQLTKLVPSRPGHYMCLVCGYPYLTKPYGDYFQPSYEICPSCGYQYGYDDYFRMPINYRSGGLMMVCTGGDTPGRPTIGTRNNSLNG
jgi:rubredoxin